MKQNMEWITCAPSAFWESLWELGTPPLAKRLSQIFHTQKGLAGTNPADIVAGMPQIGREMTPAMKLSAKEEYFSTYVYKGLAKILEDPKVTVVVHGYCSGWTKYYKTYKGGHYVTPVKICFDTNTIWIADPDRGVITYTLEEFQKGMDNCPCKSLILINRA
jgi:hypothetical protein